MSDRPRRPSGPIVEWLRPRTPSRAGRRPHDIRRYWLEMLLVVLLLAGVATVAVFLSWRTVDRILPEPKCPGAQVVHVPGPSPDRCTHGPDRPAVGRKLVEGFAEASGGAVFCYGDGVSGPRVEALYVHASDVASRYASVLPSLRSYAANADGVFSLSAGETGGVRHLRFVTEPGGCNLLVHDVTIPPTADDDFGSTITELDKQGYNHTDRKYLLWVESSVYCGIGTLSKDDRPGPENVNNVRADWARIDKGCWGGGVEAHELMHNLGGVQLSAPHSSGGFHCTDESDRMCYSDSPNHPAMTFPCPSEHESKFDCNHDDYFSTSPVGYLVDHWNAANSVFLAQADGTTSPTTTTTTTSTTTTTTLPPPPTTTTRPPILPTTTRPAATTTRPTLPPTTVPPLPTTRATVPPPVTTTSCRCLRLPLQPAESPPSSFPWWAVGGFILAGLIAGTTGGLLWARSRR